MSLFETMTIGQRIREARELRDMTLDEVAQRCNTTKQTSIATAIIDVLSDAICVVMGPLQRLPYGVAYVRNNSKEYNGDANLV